jgi:SAM-dependent methyltransferase
VGIDSRAPANRRTYSDREADTSWREALGLVDPGAADVVRAWHGLGAATVTGVESSRPILDEARSSHGHLPGVTFRLGDAAATGLPDSWADVVLERALVHHVPDLAAVVTEAARLLRPGGVLLIQDRTPADVAQPGSATHPRGWPRSSHGCWR